MPKPRMNRYANSRTMLESTAMVDRSASASAATRQLVTGIHLYRPVFEARKPDTTDISIMPIMVGSIM